MSRSRTRFAVGLLLAAAVLSAPAIRVQVDAAPASCGLDGVERIVAVGDVHAAYDRFVEILRSANVIDGVLFVHGGISPAVAPTSCDEINTTVRRELTADFNKTRNAPLASLAAREDGPLWYRGLAEQPDSFGPEVDEVLANQGARAIVVAHTVTPTGRIRVRYGGKVIQIDTGMQPAYVPKGRASALEIRGGQHTAIYPDRRELLLRP